MWDKLYSISLETQEIISNILEKQYNSIGDLNNKSRAECLNLYGWFYAGSAILDVCNRMNIDYGMRCGKQCTRIDIIKYADIFKQQVEKKNDRLCSQILEVPYNQFFSELEPEFIKLISKYDVISVNVFLFNLKRNFI